MQPAVRVIFIVVAAALVGRGLGPFLSRKSVAGHGLDAALIDHAPQRVTGVTLAAEDDLLLAVAASAVKPPVSLEMCVDSLEHVWEVDGALLLLLVLDWVVVHRVAA